MRLLILYAFAVLTVPAFGSSAAAQIGDDQSARCNDVYSNTYSLDDQIAGCNAVIASGRLSGHELGTAYSNRGFVYVEKHDFDRAISDFDEAIHVYPGVADNYLYRGTVYMNKEDYAHAIVDFGEAIRLDPRNIIAYSNRGLIDLKQNRFQAAWNDYNAAAELISAARDFPQDVAAIALYGRGMAALRLGRTASAHADIAKAESIDGRIAGGFAKLGIEP
jgi:tetratricopeptide (TPR) repeat protein